MKSVYALLQVMATPRRPGPVVLRQGRVRGPQGCERRSTVAGRKCECRDEEVGVEGDGLVHSSPTHAPRPQTLKNNNICTNERRDSSSKGPGGEDWR